MRPWTLAVPLTLALLGCDSDGGESSEGGNDGEVCLVDDAVAFEPADESGCSPAMGDYQPLTNADGDGWPACVNDDGSYNLIDTTPSSIARVEDYEQVMELLSARSPSPDDFTAARTAYSREEGLESRLVRREDLFYPPIPESDWDPGVDADKQCTVEANVTRYADRCAGPARISPLLNEAFANGQTGEGEPAIAKAQIEASLLWFLHLSVYKEANTCLLKAKDCDSAWAYYTGGFDRSGGIGLAEEIRAVSDLAHQSIWDGFSAYRCWRELYDIETYPTVDDVDAEGQALLASADTQLGSALWYGWARLVRDRLEQQATVCSLDAEASWAFLRIAGPVLSEEAARIDAGTNASLEALWASEEVPPVEDLQAAVATIDALFGCP